MEDVISHIQLFREVLIFYDFEWTCRFLFSSRRVCAHRLLLVWRCQADGQPPRGHRQETGHSSLLWHGQAVSGQTFFCFKPAAAAARTKPPYMGRPLYCYLDCGAPHISKIDARGTGGASLFEAWGHWTSCWEWTTENKLCIFMSFLKGILCKICWLLFFTFKCHWYVLASWECNSANEYLSPELQTPINIWNSKLINK